MTEPVFDPSKPFKRLDAGQTGSEPVFDPTKPFKVIDRKSGPDVIDDAKTIAQQGLTFGASPLIAGLAGGAGLAVGSYSQSKGLADYLKNLPTNFKEGFVQAKNEQAAREDDVFDRRPVATLAGNVAAGVVTAPLTAPISAYRGLTALPKVAKALEQAPAAGRILQAAQTAGMLSIPSALSRAEDAGDFATRVGTGALTGAALQGGIEGAKPIADAVANFGKWAAKKGMTIFLGPKREAIDAYLSRSEQIKNAPSIETLKENIDGLMTKYFDDVDKSKISYDEAKQGLRALQSDVKDTINQAKYDFKVNKQDLENDLRQFESVLESKYKGFESSLKAIKSPVQVADDVQTAIADLKRNVVDGSKESYKILELDKSTYSIKGAADQVRKMANELNVKGTDRTATPESEALQRKLNDWADRLQSLPEQLPATEIKKIIQDIDRSETALYNANTFDDRVSQAYKSVRNLIDQEIKDRNPFYRAIMEDVSAKTKLLTESFDRFKDPRSTVSRLNSIGSRTANLDRDLLKRLGEATGNDFETPIAQYVSAQKTLSDPTALANQRASYPEFATVEGLKERIGGLKRVGEIDKFAEAQVVKSGLAEKLRQAEEQLAKRQTALSEAESRLEPVSRLTPKSTQATISNLLRDPKAQNIEGRKALETLSKLEGQDFVQAIDDLRTKLMFQGEYRNGSRNVLLGTIVGFFLGGFTGGAGGAAAGGAIDRFGPQVARRILDGVLTLEKTQPAQMASKIAQMNIPDEAKVFLSQKIVPQFAAQVNQTASNVIERRLNRGKN